MFHITNTETGEWVQTCREVTVEGPDVWSWSGLWRNCTATPITVGMSITFNDFVDNRYVARSATVKRVNTKTITVEDSDGVLHKLDMR